MGIGVGLGETAHLVRGRVRARGRVGDRAGVRSDRAPGEG